MSILASGKFDDDASKVRCVEVDELSEREQAALLAAMDCEPVELGQAAQEDWGEPICRGWLAARMFYASGYLRVLRDIVEPDRVRWWQRVLGWRPWRQDYKRVSLK